eukprot:jgi/Mesvir1/14191/Mv09648-RA.1
MMTSVVDFVKHVENPAGGDYQDILDDEWKLLLSDCDNHELPPFAGDPFTAKHASGCEDLQWHLEQPGPGSFPFAVNDCGGKTIDDIIDASLPRLQSLSLGGFMLGDDHTAPEAAPGFECLSKQGGELLHPVMVPVASSHAGDPDALASLDHGGNALAPGTGYPHNPDTVARQTAVLKLQVVRPLVGVTDARNDTRPPLPAGHLWPTATPVALPPFAANPEGAGMTSGEEGDDASSMAGSKAVSDGFSFHVSGREGGDSLAGGGENGNGQPHMPLPRLQPWQGEDCEATSALTASGINWLATSAPTQPKKPEAAAEAAVAALAAVAAAAAKDGAPGWLPHDKQWVPIHQQHMACHSGQLSGVGREEGAWANQHGQHGCQLSVDDTSSDGSAGVAGRNAGGMGGTAGGGSDVSDDSSAALGSGPMAMPYLAGAGSPPQGILGERRESLAESSPPYPEQLMGALGTGVPAGVPQPGHGKPKVFAALKEGLEGDSGAAHASLSLLVSVDAGGASLLLGGRAGMPMPLPEIVGTGGAMVDAGGFTMDMHMGMGDRPTSMMAPPPMEFDTQVDMLLDALPGLGLAEDVGDDTRSVDNASCETVGGEGEEAPATFMGAARELMARFADAASGEDPEFDQANYGPALAQLCQPDRSALQELSHRGGALLCTLIPDALGSIKPGMGAILRGGGISAPPRRMSGSESVLIVRVLDRKKHYERIIKEAECMRLNKIAEMSETLHRFRHVYRPTAQDTHMKLEAICRPIRRLMQRLLTSFADDVIALYQGWRREGEGSASDPGTGGDGGVGGGGGEGQLSMQNTEGQLAQVTNQGMALPGSQQLATPQAYTPAPAPALAIMQGEPGHNAQQLVGYGACTPVVAFPLGILVAEPGHHLDVPALLPGVGESSQAMQPVGTGFAAPSELVPIPLADPPGSGGPHAHAIMGPFTEALFGSMMPTPGSFGLGGQGWEGDPVAAEPVGDPPQGPGLEGLQWDMGEMDTSLLLAGELGAYAGSGDDATRERQQRMMADRLNDKVNEACRAEKGRRGKTFLPPEATEIMRGWLIKHFLHPYPTQQEKKELAAQSNVTIKQVSDWFVNARARIWKPTVEELYQIFQAEDKAKGIEPKGELAQQGAGPSSSSVRAK